MNKKIFLDYLYYEIGKQQYDFKISGLNRTDKGNKSTRWFKYSEKIMPLNPDENYKIEWINQRQILPNEIVVDLEERNTIKEVLEKIKSYDHTNYKIFDTGSRGYHIHLFFPKELTEKQKEKYLQRLGADTQLNSNKHMINLEYAKHWKSGKIKIEVGENEL
ncbi:MAG: hypothetical protein PHS54_01385 [Clostridia bacterium]|nr:hypothetical protein [Clostridia bacterium]